MTNTMNDDRDKLKRRWVEQPTWINLRARLIEFCRDHAHKTRENANMVKSEIGRLGATCDSRNYPELCTQQDYQELADAFSSELVPLMKPGAIDACRTNMWDLRGFHCSDTSFECLQLSDCDLSYVDTDTTQDVVRFPEIVQSGRLGISARGFVRSKLTRCRFVGNDLSNIVDLGGSIDDCQYSAVKLWGAGIAKCYVRNTVFESCTIRPSRWHIVAESCHFENCDMQGFPFLGVSFQNAVFRFCNLRKAKAWPDSPPNIKQVVFDHCDLRGAVGFPLSDAEFIHCQF